MAAKVKGGEGGGGGLHILVPSPGASNIPNPNTLWSDPATESQGNHYFQGPLFPLRLPKIRRLLVLSIYYSSDYLDYLESLRAILSLVLTHRLTLNSLSLFAACDSLPPPLASRGLLLQCPGNGYSGPRIDALQ